jgi:hypothetical protein
MTSPPFRLNYTVTAAFHPMAEAHGFSRPFFIMCAMQVSERYLTDSRSEVLF